MKRIAVVISALMVLLVHGSCLFCMEPLRQENPREGGEYTGDSNNDDKTYDRKKEKELLEKGISCYESEEYLEAIEILQEVIDMNPENAEAIEYLLRSMQANIPSPDIHDELFIRGVRNYLLKEYKAAIDVFKTILRVSPEHGEAKDYIVRSEQGLQRMQDEKEKAARKEEERRARISEADEKADQVPLRLSFPHENKEERIRLAKRNERRIREVVDDFLEYYNRHRRGRLSVHAHYWYDPSKARWASPPDPEWEITGHDLSGTTATVKVRFPSYYLTTGRSRYRKVWIFDMHFAEADNPRNPNCWTVRSIRETRSFSR